MNTATTVRTKDLALEFFHHCLGWFAMRISRIVRPFFPRPLPDHHRYSPPPPVVHVIFNARELAYVLGEREIRPSHIAAAIELDGSLIQKRYWRVMPMTAEAEAAWKAAIAAAGDITKVTLDDLRSALAEARQPPH